MVSMPEEELYKIAVKGGVGELEKSSLLETTTQRKTGARLANVDNRANEIDNNVLVNASEVQVDNQISNQEISPVAQELIDNSAAIVYKQSPGTRYELLDLLHSFKIENDFKKYIEPRIQLKRLKRGLSETSRTTVCTNNQREGGIA